VATGGQSSEPDLGLGLISDSSVLIYLERNLQNLGKIVTGREEESCGIPPIPFYPEPGNTLLPLPHSPLWRIRFYDQLGRKVEILEEGIPEIGLIERE
jgi:hypothetical protein